MCGMSDLCAARGACSLVAACTLALAATPAVDAGGTIINLGTLGARVQLVTPSVLTALRWSGTAT